jgi:uncharacterized protein (DUF1015 family)
MAVIKPFRALRYDYDKAGPPETVCCPPFDVIPDPSVWTGKNPHNAVLLEGGKNLGTPDPYKDAQSRLESWMESGILREDETPAFYVYRSEFEDQNGNPRVLRGFAALMELSPFSEGVVLPHEFTLEKDREDRLKLMSGTGCQFSAIYCVYDDPEGKIVLPDLEPEVSFTMPDGGGYALSRITCPDTTGAWIKAFADKKVYIADGHHRYETLLHLNRETGSPKHAMVFLADMNDPGVEVRATHRVVSNLPRYDEESLRRTLGEKFDFSEDGIFGWVTASGTVRLTPKQPLRGNSAVAALHNEILGPMLGVCAETMAKGGVLTYTRDAAEAQALVASGRALCAFLLPPPAMSELRDTIAAGEKMPQKATYFYPKIITGLFMRRFTCR